MLNAPHFGKLTRESVNVRALYEAQPIPERPYSLIDGAMG